MTSRHLSKIDNATKNTILNKYFLINRGAQILHRYKKKILRKNVLIDIISRINTKLLIIFLKIYTYDFKYIHKFSLLSSKISKMYALIYELW